MEALTLHTHQGINDVNPISCACGKTFTGKQVLDIACLFHQIEIDDSVVLKIFPEENVERVLDLDKTLEEQGIQDHDHIFIFKCSQSVQSIPILSNGLEVPPFSNAGFSVPFLTSSPYSADLLPESDPIAQFQPPPQSMDYSTAPNFTMSHVQSNMINPNFESENMEQLNQDIPAPLEQADNFFSPEKNPNISELGIQTLDFSEDFEDFSTDLYSIAPSHKSKFYTILTKNPQSNSSISRNITYKCDFSFEQVVQSAKENLGMRTDNYEILMLLAENSKEWFNHSKLLEEYNIFSNTILFILKARQLISIKGRDNKTFEMIIDITDKVSKIIENYAQNNDIDDVEGYSLFIKTRIHKRRTLIPLRTDLDIPSQYFDFSNLVFKRRFFAIPGQLLSTEHKLYQTYNEIVKELSSNCNIFMTREEAIALTAYRAIAESENSRITLETETHHLVPKIFKHQKIRVSHCVKYIGHRKLTKIEAMIEYIKLARLIPGLGAFDFKVQFEERHSTLAVTPYEIILTEPNGEETVINYKQFVKIESYGMSAIIYYSKNRKLLSLAITSNQVPDIEYSINTYNQLIRSCILKRAEWYQRDPTKDTESSTSMIQLKTMIKFDYQTSSTLEYDINLIGRKILESTISNLGIRGGVSNFALMSESESGKKWIKLDEPLLLQEIHQGCILHLMPHNNTINIRLPDGSIQTLICAVTLTCDEIIQLIFRVINQEFRTGYALYNNGVPMSGELSLPEQANFYSNLCLQRRFFMISRDDIPTPTMENFVFADLVRYIMSNELKIHEKDMAACIAYILQISGVTAKSFFSMKDNYIKANYIPKYFKYTAAFRQLISNEMNENVEKNRRSLLKALIRLTRKIECFGTESYPIEFKDITRQMQFNHKKFVPGIIHVGPNFLKFIYTGSNTSQTIYYQDVANLTRFNNNIFLEYNHKGRLKRFEIRCEKHEQLYDMIGSSARIFNNIIKEKMQTEIEITQEEKSRLNGTFVDIDGEHSPQIDVYVYKDLSIRDHSILMWFDIDCSQEELLRKAMEKLNITPGPKDVYGVMLRRKDKFTTWLKPGMKFSDINPTRKSSIYIIPRFHQIIIDTLIGFRKSVTIDLSNKVSHFITPITQLFDINVPYGYTLWSNDKPLDLKKTIPEQTNHFSTLVLRHRFYPTYKEKNPSNNELIQCYMEMKDIAKKGYLEFSHQQAVLMAYYELCVIYGARLTKKLIPKDLTAYLPPNIPSSRSIWKEVVKFFKTEHISENVARKEYIWIVRNHPKFAIEEFPIEYNNIGMLLSINPEWISIKNLITKKDVTNIPFNMLLNITGVDNSIMIDYLERANGKRSILFRSDEINKILFVVSSYAKIKKEMILDASLNEMLENSNDIIPEYCGSPNVSYGNSEPKRLIFDMRKSTDVFFGEAVSLLNLDETKKYSILIDYNKQAKWLVKQKPVGIFHPYDGIGMVVYDQNHYITVIFRKVEYKVTINVSSSIESIVEMLAYMFGLWSHIGYTLFIKKDNIEMVPLKLNESIPEQASLNDLFYFDRQFYIITQYDLSIPFVVIQLMEDFKHYILSGAVSLRDKDLLELIACDFYAHAFSPMEVKQYEINDISSYFPEGYSTKRNLESKLSNLIKISKIMDCITAAQQYILIARDLEWFSSKRFRIQMLSNNEYIDARMYINSISIKFKDMKETCLVKVSLKRIISVIGTKDVMQIRALMEDGAIVVIQIRTPDCTELSNYLGIICNNIIPKIAEHEEMQKNRIMAETRSEEDLPISVITKPTANPVPIYLPKQLIGQEVNDFLAKVFFIKDYKDYKVFTLQNSNKKVLQDNQTIVSLDVNPGDIIYFIPTKANVMVTFLDTIYDFSINLTSTVAEICTDIANQLNLGSSEGFTLYFKEGRVTIPLNPFDFILCQTKSIWNLEIRRRFYNFSPGFFEDERSVQTLYQDVKRSFLEGKIHASNDIIIQLAVLTVFADKKDISIFENDKDAIRSLFPEDFELNENAYQQFKMSMENYKQKSDKNSIKEFLAECVELNGYGSEEYKISIAGNNVNKQKNGKIILSPFNIKIISHKNDKVYMTILYKNLIQFLSSYDNIYMIKYYDANGTVELVNIIGEIEIPDIINTYITGVLSIRESMHFLYTSDEYREGILRTFPEHVESNSHVNPSSNDLDPLSVRNSGLLNFNDLSDIYVQYYESTISDQDFFSISPDIDMFEFNFNTPDYGSSNSVDRNIKTDAISGAVALKSLNAIQSFLDQINMNLSTMVPYQFDTFVNQMTDIFNSICIGRDAQLVSEIFEQINDLLQEMKIIANDMFSKNNSTAADFSEQINNTISNLTQKLNQVMPMINGTIKSPVSDILVAKAIFSVANSETSLAVAIMGCKRFISKSESIYSLIYNSALNFANIVATISNDTEMESIDQMILPHITDLSQIIHRITDICENNGRISDQSSLQEALKETRTDYENLIAIISPKKEEPESEGLPIEKSATNINDAIRVIRDLAMNLPTNVASGLMSSQVYLSHTAKALKNLSQTDKTELSQYVAQKAMFVLRDQIQKLNANNTIDINLNEITQIQHELESAVYLISQVNITIANVSSIHQDVKNMINILESYENNEANSQIIHELVQCSQEIESAKNNLIGHCVNAEYIQQNLNALLRLKAFIGDFGKMAESLKGDSRLSLVIEKLETDLDLALCEPAPNEDLNHCTHIARYHEAQSAVAKLINVTQALLHQDLNLSIHDSIEQIDTHLQEAYNKIALQRTLLHETPLSPNVIKESEVVLNEALEITQTVRNVAIDLFKETGNHDLDLASKDTFKLVQDCVTELEKVKTKKYYKPPTVEQIDNIKMTTQNVIMKIEQEKLNSEGDENRLAALNKESEYLKDKIEAINSMKTPDDLAFYVYAEKISNRIQTIPDRIAETERIVQSAMSTFRFHLKAFHPTAETVKSDMVIAIKDIDAMIDCLNTFHDSITRSDVDGEAALSKWIKGINEEASILKARVTKEYKQEFVQKDKATMSNLEEQLNNVPMIVRRYLSNKQSQKLSTLMSKAIESQSNLLNCMRNFPFNGSVSINVQDFPLFEEEDDIVQSINELSHQLEELREIYTNVTKLPQIARKPQTECISKKIAAKVTQISKDVQVSLNDENGLKLILVNAEKEMKKITKDSELVQSILSISSLNNATENVSRNISMVMKLMQVPHMSAKDITSFKTKIKPKLAFLISSIKEQKIESLSEYNSALDTFKSHIDNVNSRAIVEVCDSLYDKLIQIQERVVDGVDLKKLTDQVLDTLTVITAYIEKPPIGDRYTANLIPSNAPILGEDVFDTINEFIRNSVELTLYSRQVIQENILDITKNPKNYPLYMNEVKYLSQFAENSHSSLIVRIASILALFNPEFNDRRCILEKICASSYSRFVKEVKAFAEVLEKQYLSGKLEKKRQEFLESVKECDASTVSNAQSLAAISLMFEQFHLIESCLQEMKDYDNQNIKLQCYNCERWIYESDLALVALLYGEIDCLCVKLEEENFNLASSFVRRAMLYLKSKERLCSLNPQEARNLYDMFTEFCNTDLGNIESPEIHEMVNVIKMNAPFITYAKLRISVFSTTPKKVVVNSAFSHFKSDIKLLSSLKGKSPIETAIEFKRLKSYIDEGISAFKGMAGMKDTMSEIRHLQSMIEAIDININTNIEMVNGILPALIPHLDKAIRSVQSRELTDVTLEEQVKPSLLTLNQPLALLPQIESPLITTNSHANKSNKIRVAVEQMKETAALIPRKECIGILNAESASLIPALVEADISNEKLFELLNRKIPQIAAVADVVMKGLPEKVKNIINTDSNKLIDLTSQLGDTTINDVQLEYVKLTLGSSLTCINAATSPSININGKDSVVALYQSIVKRDTKQAIRELSKINAVRVFNIVNGIEDKEMDMLSDFFAKLSTQIMNKGLNKGKNKLRANPVKMKPLVDVLIKSRPCSLDKIYSSENEEQLIQLTQNTIESFDKEADFVLNNELDEEEKKRHFSYMSSYSYSIFASVLHNVTMHNVQDIEIYQDLSSRINQIVSNIQNIDNHDVALKRRIRSINRMISSSSLFFEVNEAEQKKGIEKTSLDMSKAISNIVTLALGMKATMDSIIIDEVSNEKLKPFMNQVEYMKAIVRTTQSELLSRCTDEGAGEVFSKTVEYFIGAFDNFIKSKRSEDLMKVSEAANLCIESVSQFAKKQSFEPDTERADMIPTEFEVPQPVITDIHFAADHIERAVAGSSVCINEMKATDIVDVFPRFIPLITEAVQYCIAASHEVTSLQMQSRLTDDAASIISDMSQLFSILRSRYLTNADVDPLPLLESITITLGDAVVATREASDIAEKEEMEHNEVVLKFTKILKHLQSALKTVELSVSSIEINGAKEWTQPLFKVCSLLINSTVHVVLKAKEGPLSERTNRILQFAYDISAKVVDVYADTCITTDAWKVIAKTMDDISVIIKTSEDIEGFEQAMAETQALKLFAGMSQKGPVRKVKRNRMSSNANAHLLDRLHYESRVIKARMILERSELLIRSLG